MTAIGELNRRLVLEAPVETDDGAGGVTRSYATGATVWASIAPFGARHHGRRAGARRIRSRTASSSGPVRR